MKISNEIRVSFGQNLSGAFGRSNGFGRIRFGFAFFGLFSELPGIYQRQLSGGKKQVFKRNFHSPTNPQTPAQQARRSVFASGVVAWQSLTSEQKSVYNKKAKKFRFEGFNLFMREWLNSN